MKLYKHICLGAFALFTLGALSSCDDEKATLSGAHDVYIEMSQTEYNLQAGETVIISAKVTNADGDEIVTPITWSVDDESVAKVVKIRKFTIPKKKSSRAEGDETEGGEEDNDTIVDPIPEPEPVDTIWTEQWGLVGQPGAQGKQTRLRATLENGMFGLSLVNVNARNAKNSVTALTTFKRSYQRQPNDTLWFSVTPIELIDEAEMSYEFKLTNVISHIGVDLDSDDAKFSFNENEADNYIIDRENQRVGVLYTAPLLSGEAEGTLRIKGADGVEASASVPILVCPLIWPGFEDNGKRPGYGPPTPSNIKKTLITATMDINSTYDVGVCNGIDCGNFDREIGNTYALEEAGKMYWEVEGSAVVVEDVYADFDYTSGYVSYLRVRSGTREGAARIIYHMADTTLVCNLTVENFNVSHPVERIVVKQNGEEVNSLTFTLGDYPSIDVSVEPMASFTYHIPQVTVDDPSILDVKPRGDSDGTSRSFNLYAPGTTNINITSLDKNVTIPVTVVDKINGIKWAGNYVKELFVDKYLDVQAIVTMASGLPSTEPITWHTSDPSVISITETGYGQAKLHSEAVGTATVYAEAGGFRTDNLVIEVKATSDIHVNASGNTTQLSDFRGSMQIMVRDSENSAVLRVRLPYAGSKNFAGSYMGVNLTSVTVGSSSLEGGTCNFTVTDAGEYDADKDADVFIIDGTIVLSNGSTVYFENVRAFVYR